MARKRTVSRDEVRRLHQEGQSDRQIAAVLGCSKNTVLFIRRELKLVPPSSRQCHTFTPAEIKKLRKLSLTGLSYHKIGLLMGRAESSCRIKLVELAILDEIKEDGEGELRRKPNGMPYLHIDEDLS